MTSTFGLIFRDVLVLSAAGYAAYLLYRTSKREYMADAGSVELMRDNQPLGKALLKIASDHDQNYEQYQKAYGRTAHENVRQAAYIFDPFDNDIHPIKSTMSFFSTHPAIRDRLDAIGFKS